MKLSSAVGSTLLLAVAASGCNAAGTSVAGTPETLEERASYSLGFSAGEQLNGQGGEVDLEQLIHGLRDAFAGNGGEMTAVEMQATMDEFQQMAMAEANEAAAEEARVNEAEGDAYREDYAGQPGVMVTDSGLMYEVLVEGDGASPLATDQVTVHYTGTLIDGEVFDSSVERGQPATFPLTQVISGWTEGLQLMNIGAKFRFVIPGDLGYGMNPRGGAIGPMDTLVFEVELLEINGQS